MALGMLDGGPFDSPIHEGILLTCMIEMLPYVDSDKSEFPSTWPFVCVCDEVGRPVSTVWYPDTSLRPALIESFY
jgi:hypothetical protein